MSVESRIYDSGYRRYDGPRLGSGHATRSLTVHTLQRIFGLHRPARAKVLPFLIAIIAYLPPSVFVGLAAFLPKQLSRNNLPQYGDIYGFISAVVLLFVMFVAPEALCPDRRSGVLSLYLAAPLTRARYVLAKGIAVATSLLFVTLGPPLLLLVGLSLQNAGPHGVGGFALTLLRILLAGIEMTAMFTALSLAVSSLTERRAVAAAGTFIFVQATNAVSTVLVRGINLPSWLIGFGLGRVPFDLARQIHGERLDPREDIRVSIVVLIVACVLWTAAGLAVAWRRYRDLQVTR